MPVYKVGDKYKVGKKGKPMYRTKAAADRAYKAYLAKKHGYKRKIDKSMHSYGEIDFDKKTIRVNPRKGELLNTIVHEELHRKFPDKGERWIKKKTIKEENKLVPSEAVKLLKKYIKKRRDNANQ